MIVACVMTLEARDNAAKIVPATACLETAAAKPIDRSDLSTTVQSVSNLSILTGLYCLGQGRAGSRPLQARPQT